MHLLSAVFFPSFFALIVTRVGTHNNMTFMEGRFACILVSRYLLKKLYTRCKKYLATLLKKKQLGAKICDVVIRKLKDQINHCEIFIFFSPNPPVTTFFFNRLARQSFHVAHETQCTQLRTNMN